MAKVVINAGHTASNSGYEDHGAVGSYSYEGDITKAVAEIVVDDLSKVGYEALFVQNDDLNTICNISNGFNADVFVSVHCNSSESPEAHGAETFYWHTSGEGKKLAGCIQNQLVDTFDLTDRGLKQCIPGTPTNFCVVRETDAVACLVELAFISNPTEEDLLNNNIEKLAHAVARGISDYFAVKG
jgi:N-acetylmuramoyl-L-alanine amidase